jgi:hypothetical protein
MTFRRAGYGEPAARRRAVGCEEGFEGGHAGIISEKLAERTGRVRPAGG